MKYGEIISLGNHRLMYGDATNRDDVMRLVDGERVNLVLTDPPYGIRVIGNKPGGMGLSTHKYKPVIGDNSSDMAREHYHIARVLCNNIIIWGGQNFTDFLPPTSGWLFWDKMRSEGLSFSDGELAWSNVLTKIMKYSHRWDGSTMAGSRQLNPCPRVHPTQKPVELHAKIIEDFTSPGDVILDCFGGSGTTLIACEITGRKCLMMEISPEYCEIIAARFQRLADGKIPFEE